MKLDRNIGGDGRGKYGLVKNRELTKRAAEAKACHDAGSAPNESELEAMRIVNAVSFLEAMGVVEWGEKGTEHEFFVVKLKDSNAPAALYGYASSAQMDGDRELSADVSALAVRAGRNHPNCKRPD